jgi:hypothetical protein
MTNDVAGTATDTDTATTTDTFTPDTSTPDTCYDVVEAPALGENQTPILFCLPDAALRNNSPTLDQRVGRFFWDGYLCKKKVSRLEKIQEYFTDTQLTTVLLPIIKKDCALSLRALDWLVTNYSKKIPVIYKVKPPNCPEVIVNIYRSYKSWLWNHKRKNFDPFRRGKRIMFKIHETDATVHESTVGQLNFFFWASRYGVLDFAQSNIKEIEKDQAVATKILPDNFDDETTSKNSIGVKQVVVERPKLQPSTDSASVRNNRALDKLVDASKQRIKQPRDTVAQGTLNSSAATFKQKQGNKKKRRQLSHPPKETVFVYPTTIRVVFNPEINQI